MLIRWVAVLPAAAVSAALVLFVTFAFMNFVGWFWFNTIHSFGVKATSNGISAFLMGRAFIYGGIYTAPSHRQKTSRVLYAVGLVVLVGFVCLAIWSLVRNGAASGSGWTIWASAMAAISMTFFGLRTHEEEQIKLTEVFLPT